MSWKQNGNYPESMFGIEFREKYEDIAKQLSDEKGFYDYAKSFTKDGYAYKAKQVTRKSDGKAFTFVERTKLPTEQPKPAQTPLTPEQQRAADIQRLHNENMAASKALTDAINGLAAAIEMSVREGNRREDKEAGEDFRGDSA